MKHKIVAVAGAAAAAAVVITTVIVIYSYHYRRYNGRRKAFVRVINNVSSVSTMVQPLPRIVCLTEPRRIASINKIYYTSDRFRCCYCDLCPVILLTEAWKGKKR